MKLTDTHCHIYGDYYDDIEEVLNKSKDLGVDRYFNCACDGKSMREVIELSKNYPSLIPAIGIHPEAVDTYTLDDIKYLEEHVKDSNVVAIGEIGLDYHYTKENRDKQIELLKRQLKLAMDVNKPVIIHSRDATEDTIEILKDYQLRGVIHAFSGSLETAKRYIKMGYLLGIGGVITFKNCNLKEVVKNIDLEHIIIETDAPYLAPVPHRGETNIPGYAMETARYVAELKGIDIEELVKITNDNIRQIFDK